MKSSKKKSLDMTKKKKKKDTESMSGSKSVKELEDMEDVNSGATITTAESTRSVKKRGVTAMSEVILKKARGKKIKVSFTPHGTPNGPTRKILQSYIGTLARTMVPINVSSWPNVDKDLKESIWEDVEGSFKLPVESKRMVLTSAGTKWRQFKTMLTRKYVLPNLGRKRKLRKPPKQYNFVGLDPWKKFVQERKTPEWLTLHNEQSERVGKRKYPHRLSRLGYIGLEEKLRKQMPEGEEIDRAVLWKKARENKSGEIDEDVAPVITEIDALLEKKKNGELKISGSDDVLTKVLKTPEHSGRVRGVGGYVNPSTYFNIPRAKPDRVSRATLLARDLERDRELEETKKKLHEESARQREFFLQKFASLEALVKGNTPNNDLVEALVKAAEAHEREKLVSPISEKASFQHPKDENPEAKHDLCDENVSDDEVQVVTDIKINGTQCELAVGSTTNIVAWGTIIEEDSANKTIHGIKLRDDCIRVSVDGGIQDDAALPYPVKDELETVQQAIGSHVAWPRNLVITKGQHVQKKNVVASKKELKFDQEVNLDHPMVPKRCKLLYKHAKQYMSKTGQSIRMMIDANVFGYPRELYILAENIIDILEMNWIGAGIIAAYMMELHEELNAKKLLDTFGFVDPSFAYKRPSKEVERHIVDRMKEGKSDRIFLMPHNPGKHWVLTIIWEDEIYLMDSMAKPIRYIEWEKIVTSAVKTFHAETGGVKKVPKWKQLPGAPKQPGGHECGYYVMRYMKEVVEDVSLSFPTKWAIKNRKEYTQDELDEVRIKVSDYLGTIM